MVKQDKDKTASMKKTVYELVGENRPPFKRGVDPLDDILLDEEKELSREVKRLRLEQIVMKRRQELNRMKEGGDMDMGTLPSNTDFLNMARFLSELSPEEAQRVRSSYTFFKLAEKGSGGGGMQLLPMLLNYAKSNPGSSEGDMLKYLQLMDLQFSKGLELAKAVNPGQSEDSTLKFLGLMKDLVIEGVRNPVLQAIEKSQPSPGVFEQILTKPELWNRAKEIGMFGGSNTAASQIDLEIEKLRGERHLQVSKWDLELRRDELKREAEDRRTENLLAFVGPLAAAFGGPAAQRMKDLGHQQANVHNPTSTNTSPPGAAPQKSVQLRCSCGYQGTATLTDPPASELQCPECGLMLRGSTPEYSSREEP